jgi:hypothetical protein
LLGSELAVVAPWHVRLRTGLVKQSVDVRGGGLTALGTSAVSDGGEEPQLGIDNLNVAHRLPDQIKNGLGMVTAFVGR